MKQMNKFNIDIAASKRITSEEINLFVCQNNNGFTFQKVVERGRHYSDLAISYLEVSYICEEIANLGKVKSFEIDWESEHHPIVQFVIEPEKLAELQKMLYEMSKALADENEDEFWWIESLEGYKNNIQKRKLKFPELADDYFANLINGAYNEYESNFDNPEEFRTNILKQTPEHLFGFWKCMYSDTIKQDFYVSSESWIIPPQSDLKEILRQHSAAENFSLEEGNLFSLDGGYYVVNENYLLRISFPALAKAFQCVSHVFNQERSFCEQHNWLHYLNNTCLVRISDYANFVMFTCNDYRIILWDQFKLTFNEINQLNKRVNTIFKTTSALIGLKASISCNWSELNDESFEELCYDIIYYDPRFDNKTIRKMGKSRSRDGGRDIVVYTHERIRYKPEKFIFQCKLLKPNRSLTATKVLDISDIIEQYEADGYGIFTSGIIDSTLFDKIDKIANRRNLKTILSSKYELERDLAMLTQIKDRHFKQLNNG